MRHAPWVLAALILLPAPSLGQSYQRYADGLVSVHARKLVTAEHRVEFRVCAALLQQEQAGLVQVRLTFRDTTDGVLAQETRALDAQFGRSACQTMPSPVDPARISRWEISRFWLQRPPLATPRESPASVHLTLP